MQNINILFFYFKKMLYFCIKHNTKKQTMNNIYFRNRKVSINKDFNIDEINDVLNKFSNKIEDNFLITIYEKNEICRTEISKVYYNFDFSNFTKKILIEIQNYFKPEKYTLKAYGGIQEIILFGDEIFIDNERYEKMISILNSTDKSRSLSMNIGLVKQKKNASPSSYTILSSFTNKHYKSSLPEKIKAFSDNLINFNIDIDYHIKTIDDLKHYDVSIVNLCNEMLYDSNKKLIKSSELKLRALGKKLIFDYGFRKNYVTLSNLISSQINKIEDVKINSKTIYNAYMELFKNSDTSIIARESRRIIENLDKIKNNN